MEGLQVGDIVEGVGYVTGKRFRGTITDFDGPRVLLALGMGEYVYVLKNTIRKPEE